MLPQEKKYSEVRHQRSGFFPFSIPNGFLKLIKEGTILRNYPKCFVKDFIYTETLKIVYSGHLPPLFLYFTAIISLYLLYYIFIHLYITLFILALDAFLGNLQTPICFILSTSACISLSKKLLGCLDGSIIKHVPSAQERIPGS